MCWYVVVMMKVMMCACVVRCEWGEGKRMRMCVLVCVCVCVLM